MIETNNPALDELESMIDNFPVDNEHYGDTLTEQPDDDTIRLYVQNLNGLRWDKDGGRWPYICDAMESLQVDIACFSETNTNTNKYNIRKTMETISQRHFPHTRLVMAASRYETNSAYKPGGTAIMACNSITSNVKSHTRDRMGRWTSLSISTATPRPIRIISAYQVCHKSPQGTNTAAAQQRAQLVEESVGNNEPTRRQPRQAFIHDLQAFIMQVQAANEDIILVGDFNEEITEPSSGMDQLATTCGLADLFGIRLGSPTIPATYQRGHRRIDYALITPTLLPHVKAAGYDPFGYRLPSDHRGMYIDFSAASLLQQDLTPLATVEKRDFSTKTPEVVRKYVTAKMTYLRDHRFFERMEILNQSENPNNALAEQLDRDFQRASWHAARTCSKKKQAPWSPKLAECWATLHYYRLAQTAIKTTANVIPAIRKLQLQWPSLPQDIPYDVEQVKQGYNQALRQLKDVRHQAQTLREEFLLRQASLYSALEQTGKAKIVQRLMRAEMQHKIYTKIRYLRNQESGQIGLSTLKIPRGVDITETDRIKQLPDTPDHWETITIPEEIEKILIERNRHHFGQAEGTPFTKEPLKTDIGYKGDGYAADLILEGQIDYHGLTAATSLLVKHLQARTAETLDGEVTKEQVLGKLKNWNETTTTSPSGLHLGHYHCMWRDPHLPPDDPNGNLIKEYQDELLQALVDLLNYAIKFGYTYQRWAKVVNIMLQKDQGNPRIHRLRVIHIYEADYNLLLAVKWRQALHHAEDRSLLNDGLYGSRTGRSAHDPALLEVLQNEMYRMSMKTGINFDLDATSCYDRILASLASICSRRMGMHKSIVLVNATNLEIAQYHLKTNLGVSEGHYSHCEEYPIHGTGQGSGNSPTIWCFVCSTLFDAYADKAHGAVFTSYDLSRQIKVYMVGFVDDCTQRVNKFQQHHQPSAQYLISLMTQDAQLWNDLLWTSGGALEQLKCSFHLISSDWNDDGHPFLKGGTTGISIQLTDGTTVNPTYQISNYTSHKTLGCYINPAYNNNQTWQKMQQKNTSFANLLETNYFTRSEAWTFYTAMYLPSITYPLPITPLSKHQCQQLDARFLRSLVPRCGYNRNMARAVRYAPYYMGGANFKQLYLEQGTQVTKQIYKYLNSPITTLGQMLAMTVSWTQAFLGTSKLFLTHPQYPTPPTGPSLLLDLRQFLKDIDGSLRLKDPPISHPLRVHDRHIMDIALQQTLWSDKHLKQINACRRYLQAQTLADICTGAGTRVLPQALTGVEEPELHKIRIATFNQQKPGKHAWRTWQRFLFTITNKSGVLQQPLGKWITPHDLTRHWSQFVHHPATDQLYSHYSGHLYQAHRRLGEGTFEVVTTATPAPAPEFSYPTSVRTVLDVLRPTKNYMGPLRRTPPHIPAPEDICSPWEQELLSHTRILCNQETLHDYLMQGNYIMCSDGSVKDDRATFGFVIATRQGRRLVKGHGPAPGAYPNSFRSEAYGVLATLRWLQKELAIIGLPPTHPSKLITMCLDNKSVIRRMETAASMPHPPPNWKLLPEQDVIEEISHILRSLPINIEFQWVKGHQDVSVPLHSLPLTAQLNCEADREASRYDTTGEQSAQQKVTPLPHTPCQLYINQRSITGHIKNRIYQAVTIPELHQYLQNKFHWDDNTVKLIDWTTFAHIIKKYKNVHSTIVKHVHDISPTGNIAHRNNPYLPQECPVCGRHLEDNSHVIQCPYPSRAQWRQRTLDKLAKYDNPDSDPVLIDLLQDGLRRYHQKLEPPSEVDYPAEYQQVVREQTKIGWNQIYKGRWSQKWAILQSQHCRNTRPTSPQATGPKWVLSIGRLLMDQWLELWQIRNQERHGKDLAEEAEKRKKVVIKELTALYEFRNQVCPSEMNLFYASVEEHVRQHPSTTTLESWIDTHKDAIKASSQQAMQMGIRRNRTLYDYPMFNPIPQANQQASLPAGLLVG